MIGMMLGSCAGMLNELVGDPAGKISDRIENAKRAEQNRIDRLPQNRLAKIKTDLYYKKMGYENDLFKEERSSCPCLGIIELYKDRIKKCEDELNML